MPSQSQTALDPMVNLLSWIPEPKVTSQALWQRFAFLISIFEPGIRYNSLHICSASAMTVKLKIKTLLTKMSFNVIFHHFEWTWEKNLRKCCVKVLDIFTFWSGYSNMKNLATYINTCLTQNLAFKAILFLHLLWLSFSQYKSRVQFPKACSFPSCLF